MRKYRVAEWVSTPPIAIPPTTTLAAAQQIMEQCYVRRLPVVQGIGAEKVDATWEVQ
jgi:hypothetical protein